MIALLLLAAWQEPAQQTNPFATSELRIPRGDVVLALDDANGDGRLDLFQVGPKGVSVYLQNSSGEFPDSPGPRFSWPSSSLAWDLDDLDGDGRTELLLFVDGLTVQSYALDDQRRLIKSHDVLSAKGWLPPGQHRVNFARDVDGDGRIDLVLPDQRAHRIHLAQADAESGYAAALEVRYSAAVRYQMGDPKKLKGRFGRSVRVPWFELRDVDGDGTRDLISKTPGTVAFHLARPKLEAEPSWSLDLVELAKQLPSQDGFNLDDLLSNIEDQVQWDIADLDGKAPNDLILGLGPKIQVFLGGSQGGPNGQPDQVLKSSGKVLTFFLRNVLGDSLPDLQLLRGERISLGRALRYLILPGRLDFDVYTYENGGSAGFSRRPTQRGTLGIQVPRLLSFVDDAEGISDAIDSQFEIPALRLDWDGDGQRNDLADVRDGKLLIIRDRAPELSVIETLLTGPTDFEELIEAFVLAQLDQRGDEGEVVYGLDDLTGYDLAPGSILRKAAQGQAPSAETAFGNSRQPTLRVIDLDGDGRDDLIGWGRLTGQWDIRLFVRR